MPLKFAVGLVLTTAIIGYLIADAALGGYWTAQIRDQLRDDPPQAAATPTGPPAGDRPNPFQDDDEKTVATSEPSEGAEEGEAPPAGDASATPQVGEPLVVPPDCQFELGIGEYVSLYAIGEVTGFGPSGRYVVLESCAGPAAYESVYGSAPSVQETAAEGGCLFVHSWLETLVAVLRTGRTVDVPGPGPLPDLFQANFVLDPVNTLAIGENRPEGVVTGAYSVGTVGQRRGDGQEWGFAGRGRLTYGTEPLGEPWVPKGQRDVVIGMMALTAEWSGESIENWTGEVAVGRVHVTCAMAVGFDTSVLDHY